MEDDPITIMVCDRIMKMHGFAEAVKSCENGKIAIDYLKSINPADEEPEIIFLDINMPVMNGWDFLEEYDTIKNNYLKSPRIFILSSTVDPEDYKKAKSFSTVEDFISKPLTKDFLDKIEL